MLNKLVARGNFYAAILQFEEWLEKIGAIRYKAFVKLLNWVLGDPENGMETDRYDKEAVHIAVFSEEKPNEIIGYVRILSADSTCGLMFTEEACFKDLLPSGFAIPPQSIEVSRLCLTEEVRKTKVGFIVSELLFRSVLAYMRKNESALLFAIADTKDERGHSHYDLLKKRFPLFEEIASGELKLGITTHIMSLTKDGLEEALAKYKD